jgi:uncharacterized protein (TIGR02646 family)
MKWIQKNNEPRKLAEWRIRYAGDMNFGYDLLRRCNNENHPDGDIIGDVTEALLEEQGYLCAYTGISINKDKCHIEHLKPQTHCIPSETVMYTNIVACFPEPNRPSKLPYGAQYKDQWPDPSQQHLFLSPLDQTCETRFFFDLQGNISCVEGDDAAKKTIEKLGLNDDYLKAWRRSTIQGVIGIKNDLPLSTARRRLNQLQAQQDGPFDEFCFVLIQALEKHIARVEKRAKKIAKYAYKSSRNKK